MLQIQDIINKYGEFSDSWISKIEKSKDHVSLLISCANKQNGFKYELIRLSFFDLEFFTNKKKEDTIAIKDALLDVKNKLVIFDIEPIDHFDFLEENNESNFKIIAKSVEYEFITERS